MVEHDMAMALLVANSSMESTSTFRASYAISAEIAVSLWMWGSGGETAAQIFAGLCTVRFGEEGYRVDRCEHRVVQNDDVF